MPFPGDSSPRTPADTQRTPTRGPGQNAARSSDSAPALSTDQRTGAPGRREGVRSVTPVSPITPGEAQTRIRATMLAHVSAAAKAARLEPISVQSVDGGHWEMRFPARWALFRGRPRLVWNDSTRELGLSVKTLLGEAPVHVFVARYPEHYGVIAQTAMSLVVARAR